MRPTFFWFLLVAWAAAFVLSWTIGYFAPPSGDGFTRGLNRLTSFFGWQIAAGVLAPIIWYQGRVFAKGTALRWVSRVPVLLALILFFAVAAVILWANVSRPVPETGSIRPVTKPASDAVAPVAEQ